MFSLAVEFLALSLFQLYSDNNLKHGIFNHALLLLCLNSTANRPVVSLLLPTLLLDRHASPAPSLPTEIHQTIGMGVLRVLKHRVCKAKVAAPPVYHFTRVPCLVLVDTYKTLKFWYMYYSEQDSAFADGFLHPRASSTVRIIFDGYFYRQPILRFYF